MKYDSRYPIAILLVIFVLGAVSGLFLPETLHQKLPDSLAEARMFGRDQVGITIFSWPSLQKKNRPTSSLMPFSYKKKTCHRNSGVYRSHTAGHRMNRRQTMRNCNGSNRPNSHPKHEWRGIATLRQQRIYANSSGDSLKRQFKLCFAFHPLSFRFAARNITLLAEKNVLCTRFIAISLISNGSPFFDWTYKEIRL